MLAGALEPLPIRVGSEPFDVSSKDRFSEESSVSSRACGYPTAGESDDEHRGEQEQRSEGPYDHCRKHIGLCFLKRQQNVHGCVEVGDEVVGPGCAEGLLGEGTPTDGHALYTGGFGGRNVEGGVADVGCFFPRDVTE